MSVPKMSSEYGVLSGETESVSLLLFEVTGFVGLDVFVI